MTIVLPWCVFGLSECGVVMDSTPHLATPRQHQLLLLFLLLLVAEEIRGPDVLLPHIYGGEGCSTL